MEPPGPTVGSSLTGRVLGLGSGDWGVENPTGGCHPVSQAVISCSVHNWAVITLWPQMGCRRDYVLLASPCLRLLTACCPLCPPPITPPQTQGQQPPAQTPREHPLTSALRAVEVTAQPGAGHHWMALVLSCKFQFALIPARREFRLPKQDFF